MSEGVTCSLYAGVTGQAGMREIPVFEVATNATVYFATNGVLKNLDFRFFGKARCEGSFTMGYAAAGETAYFEMTADGGEMTMTETKFVRQFVCPEAGGRVRVPSGKLVWRKTLSKPFTSSAYRICSVGYQNPTNEPFALEVDGCLLDGGFQGSYAGGAATVSLVNGAGFGKGSNNTHPGLYSWIRFQDLSRLVMDNASTFTFHQGNDSKQKLCFTPAVDGYEQLVLKGGSSIAMHTYNGDANRKAVLVAEDGYWEVPQLANRRAGRGCVPCRGAGTAWTSCVPALASS